jgi:hypothetical protein
VQPIGAAAAAAAPCAALLRRIIVLVPGAAARLCALLSVLLVRIHTLGSVTSMSPVQWFVHDLVGSGLLLLLLGLVRAAAACFTASVAVCAVMRRLYVVSPGSAL